MRIIICVVLGFSIFICPTISFANKNLFSIEGMKQRVFECESIKNKCSDDQSKLEYAFALIFSETDQIKGWEIVEQLSDKSFLPAIYMNAERYYKGLDGNGKNSSQFLFYARKAVNALLALEKAKWTAEDYSNLSHFYEIGVGVTKDLQKAFELALVSSSMGAYAAKMRLARMYKFGIGTEKNEKKSRELIKELREAGYFNRLNAPFRMSGAEYTGDGPSYKIERGRTNLTD
jgi:hypothetical protein